MVVLDLTVNAAILIWLQFRAKMLLQTICLTDYSVAAMPFDMFHNLQVLHSVMTVYAA
jgi:hypothetical protein